MEISGQRNSSQLHISISSSRIAIQNRAVVSLLSCIHVNRERYILTAASLRFISERDGNMMVEK